MGFLNALFGPARPPEHYTYLLKQSLEGLKLAQQAHEGAWRINECVGQVDQARGTVAFTRSDGSLQAQAPVQIIGTYLTTEGSWLWSWDNPAIQPALQLHAQRVYDYGKEFGIADLITRKLHATEDQAWLWTALAFKLNGAQGAYRGPDGPGFVYVTFGAVTVQTP
jgi:hypothetical protein